MKGRNFFAATLFMVLFHFLSVNTKKKAFGFTMLSMALYSILNLDT